MAIEVKRKLFTVDEFQRMAESGVVEPADRLELLEGEIIEMNAIGTRHAAVVIQLTHLLSARVGDRGLVSVQNPIILDARSQPQPDVTVLKRRMDNYFGGLPTPADVLLIVEVSDSTLPSGIFTSFQTFHSC